jgi:hypothetical protein
VTRGRDTIGDKAVFTAGRAVAWFGLKDGCSSGWIAWLGTAVEHLVVGRALVVAGKHRPGGRWGSVALTEAGRVVMLARHAVDSTD